MPKNPLAGRSSPLLSPFIPAVPILEINAHFQM
jgi:hypothetical protein